MTQRPRDRQTVTTPLTPLLALLVLLLANGQALVIASQRSTFRVQLERHPLEDEELPTCPGA